MKLSVSLIVKNEEDLLGRCLESVKDADEIVVCDTGSEDHTVEIAKRYTDKIFTDYTWDDSFCEARNHSLTKCTGDWIFIIDADEFLEPGGIQKIREHIATTSARVIDIPSENETDLSVHWLPRLFVRAPDIFYRGAIHNHLSVLPTEKLSAMITYGYSPAHTKDPDRTLRILKKELEKDPALIREKFYLAREMWYRHDFETALEWYDKYLAQGKFWAEVADAYVMRARCLWYLQRGEEARDSCLQAIKLNTNFQEALEFMAEMSGPGNRKRWLEFASTASNVGILFIRANDRKRVYYCDGMQFFGSCMEKYHGYQRYNAAMDIYKDTFFEGLYFDEDYRIFQEHQGKAIVFWNGSDLLRLAESKSNQEILRNKTNVTHLCHDIWQRAKLSEYGISARVRPLFFGNINRYQITYQQSARPRVYLNAHPGREEEYGIPEMKKIAEYTPGVEFHVYGLSMYGPTMVNVYYHGHVTEEQFDAETDSMQGCLFLYQKKSNFRISQTCLKAAFRGHYIFSSSIISGSRPATPSSIASLSDMESPNKAIRDSYLEIYQNAWEGIWIRS